MALTWQTHFLALACGEYLVHLGGGLLVTWGSKSRANSRKGLHEKLGLGFQLGPLLSKCVTRASDTPSLGVFRSALPSSVVIEAGEPVEFYYPFYNMCMLEDRNSTCPVFFTLII